MWILARSRFIQRICGVCYIRTYASVMFKSEFCPPYMPRIRIIHTYANSVVRFVCRVEINWRSFIRHLFVQRKVNGDYGIGWMNLKNTGNGSAGLWQSGTLIGLRIHHSIPHSYSVIALYWFVHSQFAFHSA